LGELDNVKEQNEKYLSRPQRLQADVENFKRRTKKQSEHISKYASAELIKELLVVAGSTSELLERWGMRAAKAFLKESSRYTSSYAIFGAGTESRA
jgi:molecular chaperone GrpE (heat shock protein)